MSVRSAEETKVYFTAFEAFLAADIVANADDRIQAPEGVAAAFVEMVRESAVAFHDGSPDPVLSNISRLDIAAAEIEHTTSLGNVARLIVFRGKAEIAARAAGLPARR